MSTHETDAELLARFVASFAAFDDLYDLQARSTLLAGTDESGLEHWHPRQTQVCSPPW
jgi:hypothetical protein